MKGFADLADCPEDVRIDLIVDYARKHPTEVIAVVVDGEQAEPGKADRYTAKLRMAGLHVTRGQKPFATGIVLQVTKTKPS